MSNGYLESSQGKAVGILLLVFIGGALSGVLGTRAYEHVSPESQALVTPDRSPRAPHLAVEHLREELDLDHNQVKKVRSVLDQCIMKQADLYVQIRAMQSEGREEILKILNEEQRQRFQTLLHEVAEE